MNSYGHYAVDNGLEPVAGEDMPAGTVVKIKDGAVEPYNQDGAVVGVLAYAVAKGDTCTIATDGVVAVRLVGAVAAGQWVRAARSGAACEAYAAGGQFPFDEKDCILGRALVASQFRYNLETLAAVHLNILPPGVGFPAADDTEGGSN